eukprot:sb/3473344/
MGVFGRSCPSFLQVIAGAGSPCDASQVNLTELPLVRFTEIGLVELTDKSKQPIRTRYLGHVTVFQPMRDQHFGRFQYLQHFALICVSQLASASRPLTARVVVLFSAFVSAFVVFFVTAFVTAFVCVFVSDRASLTVPSFGTLVLCSVSAKKA